MKSLTSALKGAERELRRAGRSCKKGGGGSACAVFDVATVMVAGARGLAATAALQGTAGAMAPVATNTAKKLADAVSLADVAESDLEESDVDD